MARRMTDSDKWKNYWFAHLPMEYQLLWLFILDTCDCAGIWEDQLLYFEACTKVKIERSELKKYLGDKIIPIKNNVFLVKKFLQYQYGNLSEHSNVAKGINRSLSRFGLTMSDVINGNYSSQLYPWLTLDQGLAKGTLRDMDKDKDKEMDMDKNNCIKLVNTTIENVSAARKEKSNQIQKIVDYLNAALGTKYKATTDNTKKHIAARLNEGFEYEDFCTVINEQKMNWAGSDMSKFLRPQTLFGPKFESYLNAAVSKKIEKVDPLKEFFMAAHPEAFND